MSSTNPQQELDNSHERTTIMRVASALKNVDSLKGLLWSTSVTQKRRMDCDLARNLVLIGFNNLIHWQNS